MGVITVPVSDAHQKFVTSLVKSGRAANKAHAIRLALDSFAREEALTAIRLGMQEVKEGKTLKGDLRALADKLG